MLVHAIEIAGGIILVVFALRDVFDTVVVPGESRGALRVARRLLAVTLPFWKWARRGKSGVSTSFALAILIGSFYGWASASSRMRWASGFHLQPISRRHCSSS